MSDLDIQFDLDTILKAKKRSRSTCYILLDPTLADRRERLIEALDEAVAYDKWHNEKDTAPAIEKQIAVVEQEIADARQPFVFESLGRKAYSALLDEYKPRKGDNDDKMLGFNADEFPPRLIALCAVAPKISLKQARKIWDGDEWSDAETTLLLGSAVLANKELADVPFTKAGLPMGIRSTGAPSNTATTEESPTPSS